MSDCNKHKDYPSLRILLAGPLPTPVGGISEHLSRLSSWLSAQGIEVDLVDEARHRKAGIYNIRNLRLLPYLRCLWRCNVAHIHSSVNLFRNLHILACRLFGLRVIVTVHSSWRPGGLITLINRTLLKLAHEVIFVSEQVSDYFGLRNYHVIPAFLPPSDSRKELPEEINNFIEKARSRGSSVICANAYELIENRGQDLYGLDLCVDLMDQLTRQSDMDVAFVFVVSCDAQDNRLYANARRTIDERDLESRFCLYNRPIDFITLMQQCDLVLRPTNTDGDALTIREALYFGIPVIASDIVQRPPGTILFRNRDVNALVDRAVDVLKNGTSGALATAQDEYDSYFQKYMDLYLEALLSPNGSSRDPEE